MYLDSKISEEEYEPKKDSLATQSSKLKLQAMGARQGVENKERVIDDALLFITNPGLYWNQADVVIKKEFKISFSQKV